MTLVAHKIVQALRTGNVLMPPGIDPDALKVIANGIDMADKVDFGEMHLEPSDDHPGEVTMPRVTEEEESFWREGLITPPSSVSWYEFVINGYRSGILLLSSDDSWEVTRLDYIASARPQVGMDGCVSMVKKSGSIWTPTLKGMSEEYIQHLKINQPRQLANGIAIMIPFSVYLTLMLNSRTTEITVEHPPGKLNKAREKRGKLPLYSHRVVTIVPRKYSHTPSLGGTHTSPRLHWRRSHLRHFDHQTAGSKFMEHKEFNGKTGWWVTVIPRFLVGKKELGEVTHDYVVKR